MAPEAIQKSNEPKMVELEERLRDLGQEVDFLRSCCEHLSGANNRLGSPEQARAEGNTGESAEPETFIERLDDVIRGIRRARTDIEEEADRLQRVI